MSGIVGIINFDKDLVEPQLLNKLTDSLSYRGPDAKNVWLDGNVGFGHTLLRTTDEAQYEQQPFSLDLQAWIVADARIDAREKLVKELGVSDSLELTKTPDVELILRAYLKWGENCVQHLLGDFSFAIWDKRASKLFCARDQYSIKAFYFAHVGNSLVFSNAIKTIGLYPAISNRPNELAIADFLLFKVNQNPKTTFFADIQRLPGGFTLSATDTGEIRSKQYWTLPLPSRLRYKHANDYVEHFQELLEQVIADRLRTDKAIVLLSGGLDSTNMAAAALDVSAKQGRALQLEAFTFVFNQLLADDERTYADIVAQTLNISLHYIVAEQVSLPKMLEASTWRSAEPNFNGTSIVPFYAQIQQKLTGRIILQGHGPDTALPSQTALIQLLKHQSLFDVAKDAFNTYKLLGVRPKVGLNILPKIYERLGHSASLPTFTPSPFPTWLNSHFVEKYDLRNRWLELNQNKPDPKIGLHADGFWGLTQQSETALHEWYEVSMSEIGLEIRFPYLDLRMLNFMLSLPPLPWTLNKGLLRLASSKRFQQTVAKRPKTALQAHPFFTLASQNQTFAAKLAGLSTLQPYVNLDELIQNLTPEKINQWYSGWPLTVFGLGQWLETISQPNFL